MMYSLESTPATFIEWSWINEAKCYLRNYLLCSACYVQCKHMWSHSPDLHTWVKVGRLHCCAYGPVLLLLMSVEKLLVGFCPQDFLLLLWFPGVWIQLAWSQQPCDMGRAVPEGLVLNRCQKGISWGGLNGVVLSAVVKLFCNTRITYWNCCQVL